MRSGSSQNLVSRAERGRVESMTVGRLRRLLAVFDAELVLYVRWRGGDVDRLVDRGHAELGERLTRLLSELGWVIEPEVSYSVFGERGSIDLLAWHAATSRLLVIELKTELTSIEETLRRHDSKGRLGAQIARERFGWQAAATMRLLLLPDARTPRRHVEQHRALFARAYPLRGWALRRWLGDPGATIERHDLRLPLTGGLLFLPSSDGLSAMRGWRGRKRIRGRQTRESAAR